jgi:hypothetical protein
MNNKTQRRIHKYFFSHYFCFVFFRKNNIRGNAATNNTPNEGENKIIQEKSRKSKSYNTNIKRIIANYLIFNSPRDLARLKALQCRESGSWLHAIPSPNIGTLLDNTSFQVCIGLRLGCNLCTPHIWKCSIHGLSCSKSSGRFSRHTEINCIINRSLTSIVSVSG